MPSCKPLVKKLNLAVVAPSRLDRAQPSRGVPPAVQGQITCEFSALVANRDARAGLTHF
jgi:hypothetical protein